MHRELLLNQWKLRIMDKRGRSFYGDKGNSREGNREGWSGLKSTFLPKVKKLTKNRTWKNLYWKQPPDVFAKQKNFLS
jgi:hypothetical protein